MQSRSEFNKAFIKRVRQARAASPHNQRQMAELLGTSTANYEKYETRSCLPHHLIGRFALAVGVSVAFLVTGREEEKPKRPEPAGPRAVDLVNRARPRQRKSAAREKTDNLSENHL